LDKSIAARRKAQQLARSGDLEGAIDEMDRVLQAGETDPYDFVFRGDLLARMNRLDGAVSAYEEAVSAYERIGLYRNAIAICKKVLRTDASRKRTHGRLGDLYAKEGLTGDAVDHFLAYLDGAGDDATGEEFIEVLERVTQLAGQRPEVTLRVSDLLVRAGREEHAARILCEIADQAEAGGGMEIALELRARAAALLPSEPEPEIALPPCEEAAVEIVVTAFEPEASGTSDPQPIELATDMVDAGTGDDGFAESAEENERESEDQAEEEDEEEADSGIVEIPLDDAPTGFEFAPCGDAGPAATETPSPHVAAAGIAVAVDAPSMSTCVADPVDSHPMESSPLDIAIAAGDWPLAHDLATALHEENPEDLSVLEKLVVVSRELGDTLATVRALMLLGDLKINEEDLEGSLACFLQVLELDPENVTARRRMSRFREMNVAGADRIPEECTNSIQGLIETDGATVTVRDHGGVESEEWTDLTALLQEFRDGVGSQIAPGDAAGHYDLGLSHHGMGLYEEALEEFGAVLIAPGVGTQMALRSRELRGDCLQHLERHREAIHEYRAALEIEGRPEDERIPVRYRLACALEIVGETAVARRIFRELEGEVGSFLDTRAHLERLGG